MANKNPNLYAVPSLPGVDPNVSRVIQDLATRVNYLTTELDRVKDDISKQVATRAKKENPVQGIVTIPSAQGNGFVRVNEDGAIVSYGNPVRSGYADPVFLGETEAAITSSSETNIRTTIIPPNFHERHSHLYVEMGGFCLTTGGNVTAFTPTLRYGSAGALASPIAFTNTFIPNGSVAVWFGQIILSHEISNSPGPDYVGLGGIFHAIGTVKDYAISRGEITMNFGVENGLYFNAAVTGTGSDQFAVNETYQVIKYFSAQQ